VSFGGPIRRVCLFVLLVLSYGLSTRAAVARAMPSDADLKKGAEKFIALVESKNAAALLELFSEQGTVFMSGTYALPKVDYSPTEIRKDFENKTGVWCVFFDTTCLREADSKERNRQNRRPLDITLFSAADLITSAKEKRFVTYDGSTANGKITLLLSTRSVDTARLGEDALNFYFRYEGGQWKLRNIEFQ